MYILTIILSLLLIACVEVTTHTIVGNGKTEQKDDNTVSDEQHQSEHKSEFSSKVAGIDQSKDHSKDLSNRVISQNKKSKSLK